MKKIKDWIKTHKIATVGIVIGIIIVGLIVSLIMMTGARVRTESIDYSFKNTLEAPSVEPIGERVSVGESVPAEAEIEVKEGSIEIKSKDAEADFADIKSIVEAGQGYVERNSKSITNLYIQINLTLRIPPEKFIDVIEKMKEEFKVESYGIKNYRVSIERALDEFDILRQSLVDYEGIREEIKEMEIGKDKIELLMELTDKELELKGKEGRYQREISSQERRGEYATLNVSLEQKKSPKIWPENVIDQLKDRLRVALDNVVKILKDLVGETIELFFRVIQIVVYVFIVGIILAGAYRLGKGLFRRIIKK